MHGGAWLAPAVALLLLVGLAFEAQATIRWSASGTLGTTASSLPVHFEEGAALAKARHFSGFALTDNKTSFTGSVLVKAGADMRVTDVVRLVNDASQTQTVTLRATQVVNPQLEVLQWTLRHGATTVATLDLLASSPSTVLVLAAGASHVLDLRADLADGSGVHNAAVPLSIVIETSAGAIAVQTSGWGAGLTPVTADVAFGRFAASSAVGLNATNASVTVAKSTVLASTTNVWHINNTAATPVFVKLVLTNLPSVALVTSLRIGIHNGTATSDQIVASLGSYTSTTGAYMRLDPGANGRIYVTQLVGLTYSATTWQLETYVADDSAESAYYTMRARVTVS